MSEKTLNLFIKIFFMVAVSCFFVMRGGLFSDPAILKFANYLFAIVFGITPVLLLIKIVSRLFLSGFKGRSIYFIENMFSIYYLMLTKEARKEWVDYIGKQKQRHV